MHTGTIYKRIQDPELPDVINSIADGTRIFVSMQEEAGAEIHRVNDIVLLFEIPLYGGEPGFTNLYRLYEVDRIYNEIRSWT